MPAEASSRAEYRSAMMTLGENQNVSSVIPARAKKRYWMAGPPGV